MDDKVMRPRLQIEEIVVRDCLCAGQDVGKGLGEGRHERGPRKRSVNLGKPFLDQKGKVIVQEQGRPGAGGPVSLPLECRPIEKKVRPGHVANDVQWVAFRAT
jgi:hypothetical protein